MDKFTSWTFQGNTSTLFVAWTHWKSMTIGIWQPESISQCKASAVFDRLHRQNSKALLWCDYIYYSVITTSSSGRHLVIKIKIYCWIFHGFWMKLLWGRKETTEDSRTLSVAIGWMTAAGEILYNRGLWLIHCVYFKEKEDIDSSEVFLKTLFDGKING